MEVCDRIEYENNQEMRQKINTLSRYAADTAGSIPWRSDR